MPVCTTSPRDMAVGEAGISSTKNLTPPILAVKKGTLLYLGEMNVELIVTGILVRVISPMD